MSLLLNMISRLVISFLPRSKHLLISWLQSPSAVILEPPKIKSVTVSPSISHEVMGKDATILVFWMLGCKPAFSLSWRGFLVLLHFLPYGWYHLPIWGYWYLSESSTSLIPACASSSLAFCIMYSAYNFNNQGESIQPWYTLFQIWNQSVVPCAVITRWQQIDVHYIVRSFS